MRNGRMEKIGVAGADFVGIYLAKQIADYGCPVILFDESMYSVKKAMRIIELQLAKDVNEGRRKESNAATLFNRIIPSDCRDDFMEVDILFETIAKDLKGKSAFYERVDEICKDSCIFVIDDRYTDFRILADTLRRPDRILGMHIFTVGTSVENLELITFENRRSMASYQFVQRFCENLYHATKITAETRKLVPNTLNR